MYKQIEIDGELWNYLIYDDGRVYSMFKKDFLSPDISSGYARYSLSNNKRKKRIPAHVLVGKAFIPNPNNLPILNHKDKNRLNNHVDNLEWISYSDNVKKENRNNYEIIKQSFSQEELEKEEWRTFRNSHYKVSNLGRLYNEKTKKIVEGHINHYLKYMRDTLCYADGHRETIPRHRIVYEAFHTNEILDIINHIDGDKTNNRLNNLENITSSENLKKAYTETRTKKTRKIKGINLVDNTEQLFFSIVEAAKFIGCNESTIRGALRREKSISHGYEWIELTEEEYNQALKSSETIESIAKEKNFGE